MKNQNSEKKENAKVETTNAKQNERKSLDSILSIGNQNLISKSGTKKSSIYKEELFFDCKTDKEKKHLRIKLRRKLENFLDTFFVANTSKSKEKIELLKKDWKEYANMVYINSEIIADNNIKEEKRKLVDSFINAMK